jgi:hypothetical protein
MALDDSELRNADTQFPEFGMCHSIGIRFILIHVEFEDGVSISGLEKQGNRPIFLKTFQTPTFGKRTDHYRGESSIFLGLDVSCERDRQPTIKFTIDPEVPFIYRGILRKSGFFE